MHAGCAMQHFADREHSFESYGDQVGLLMKTESIQKKRTMAQTTIRNLVN